MGIRGIDSTVTYIFFAFKNVVNVASIRAGQLPHREWHKGWTDLLHPDKGVKCLQVQASRQYLPNLLICSIYLVNKWIYKVIPKTKLFLEFFFSF